METKDTLEKSYNPKPVEKKWTEFWVKNHIFKPETNSSKKKYSMVLPPPNVTGSLHIGHALCFTLPDIIMRWKKMRGYNTLWLPGTDHASIAVHNVIEQNLAKEGMSKEEIGRKEFLKRAWNWKEKYGGVIIDQLKRLGTSLDWTRERFTMDEGFSYAVRYVFVQLYKEGLIYRDYYLVNQCPKCGTVLSDIEIEHKEKKSNLYYIKYPLIDSDEYITVATTRPETMLGDTAIAVHPDDKRYKKIQGKKARLPLVHRELPVILDERIDMEFGTGVVKVTPAHDPVDFELGIKHNLEQVIVVDSSGTMTDKAGPEFKGLDRFECREKIIAKLRESNLIERIEDYEHAVGHCYRCKTVIEPLLSWQWFVKIKPLAEEAIRVVEEGKIQFIPPNWSKIYFEWMYNIHDWCISRQLWWGHRIPAWYCKDCDEVTVALDPPEKCEKCGSQNLIQDEDVLDTWFSSALWPFGTMGWPEKTEDLQKFYPTDLMSTGFDIIFFWVARMIMMGLKFAGDIPFKQVFINGLVRDVKRRKMSKSEGNVIDPLEMMDKYGTDALRFTLAALAVPGMDISLSEERMAGYQAFANKIWNASRFVLMNITDEKTVIKEDSLSLADRWIRSRMETVTEELNTSLDQFKFHEAADTIYHFIWHEFCDWYIELNKSDIKRGNQTSKAVLLGALDKILKLLYPFMPFITEEIGQHLPSAKKSLALDSYPISDKHNKDQTAEQQMKLLQDAITEVRTIRAENRIPPKQKIDLWLKVKEKKDENLIKNNQDYIKTLASIHNIDIRKDFPSDRSFFKGVSGFWELAIPLEKEIDLEQEKQRLEREISKINDEIEKLDKRLQNTNFLKRAPSDVVQKSKDRLEELEVRKTKLDENLSRMRGNK